MNLDKMMQLFRTLKTAQVRKQLEEDTNKPGYQYWDDKTADWVTRAEIINGFLLDAKEQS